MLSIIIARAPIGGRAKLWSCSHGPGDLHGLPQREGPIGNAKMIHDLGFAKSTGCWDTLYTRLILLVFAVAMIAFDCFCACLGIANSMWPGFANHICER